MDGCFDVNESTTKMEKWSANNCAVPQMAPRVEMYITTLKHKNMFTGRYKGWALTGSLFILGVEELSSTPSKSHPSGY